MPDETTTTTTCTTPTPPGTGTTLPPHLAERQTPLLGSRFASPILHNRHDASSFLLPPSPSSTPRTNNVTTVHASCCTADNDAIPSTPIPPWQRHMPYYATHHTNNNSNSTNIGLLYFGAFLLTAAGLVYGVSNKFWTGRMLIDWDTRIQVAFIGNSYLFVNDVPRLLEAMSTGHVYQNSCLHPGGSLSDVWITGNGMVTLWQSDEAMMESSDGTTTYDFGLCTVAQILQGYDEYIGYGNSAGHYYDDGLNPCIVNPYYASFVADQLTHDPVHWDYVVLVDQTKRMAIPSARNDTIQVLTNGYAPFLQQSGAIPVLIDTHAFWSDESNMTGLTDIPTFTRYIVQGVQDYTQALRNVLPKRQAPLVAPIGLAYLTIWEENYTVWTKLFLDNRIHASMYGSYLLGVVLYCTLFGHLPADDLYTPFLFDDARSLMGPVEYPTTDEIQYLRNVAERVVLQRHVPDALYE